MIAESFFLAFGSIFNPTVILLIFLGVFLGIIFGCIPGLTATLGIALLLPVTFALTTIQGMAMLLGVYVGGISGGAIAAILMGIPGTPSSIATTFDGYPLTKKGHANQALGYGITASFLGGVIGGICLILISPLLARFALRFGNYEMTALVIFGLSIVIGISGESILKGLIGAVFGLLITVIGADPIVGTFRYIFGIGALSGGLDVIPVLMGLLAVSVIFYNIDTPPEIIKGISMTNEKFLPSFSFLKKSAFNIIRSSFIGTFVGALPGAGGSIASFLAYDQAVKGAKNPEDFGKGEPQGVIASEASNNGMTGGALIPMLALGIPGDAVTAILIGALMIHGIRPGPLFASQQPILLYGIFIAFVVANIFMFVTQVFAMRLFVKVLEVPKFILFPIIIVMCGIGAFAINNRIFDIWVVLIFGIIGYFFHKIDIPMAPVVLGYILGPIFERSLRVSLMRADGSLIPFITRPISAVLLLLAIISVMFSLWQRKNSYKKT